MNGRTHKGLPPSIYIACSLWVQCTNSGDSGVNACAFSCGLSPGPEFTTRFNNHKYFCIFPLSLSPPLFPFSLLKGFKVDDSHQLTCPCWFQKVALNVWTQVFLSHRARHTNSFLSSALVPWCSFPENAVVKPPTPQPSLLPSPPPQPDKVYWLLYIKYVLEVS